VAHTAPSTCPSDSRGMQRFRVYVLEMGDGSLYVGVTAQPLSERLREHRTGTGARSHRRHVYKRVRPDLAPKTLCVTRERAEAIEHRTAKALRRIGYDVRQG